MLTACFALSLGDALIKQSNTSFTLWQIFVMRWTITIPFLVYFVPIRTCETSIVPRQPTFDFTYVLFATLWGFVCFAELPNLVSGVGII